MAMKQLSKAVALAAMAMSGAVLADAPTLKEVLDASGITTTGYVDAAYTHYNVEQPASALNAFDTDKNSFNLKQASLTIASQPKEGFGAVVNLTGGNDGDVIKSIGASSGIDVTQAFVQYATGPFTAIAGKFTTLAGAEVIAPTGNTNISRSIAFFQLPYTHTGARFSVAPVDTLTLYAGVNNGWDQQKDQNTQKTLELGLAWVPTDMITWTLQGYTGKEPIVSPTTAATVDRTRTLIDTVLTIKPTKELALILNYDYGKQEKGALSSDGLSDKDAKWNAIVGYVNYQFTDEWRVSVRAESFSDKDGYKLALSDLNTGDINKKTKEYTLTVGYAPVPSFELRGEVRKDKADKKAFVEEVASSKITDGQTFLALEALYKF